MAAASTVTIQGQITGNLTGTRVIGPVTQTSAAANGSVTQVTLLLAGVTVTVPTSPAPSGCIITLPATNTQLTTLKGVTGDTGIKIGKTGTTMLSFDPLNIPTSLFFASAADQTGLYTEIQWL
jgi:hypothetical protein